MKEVIKFIEENPFQSTQHVAHEFDIPHKEVWEIIKENDLDLERLKRRKLGVGTAELLADNFQKIEKTYKENKRKLEVLEASWNDFRHYIEQYDISEKEQLYIFGELKDTFQERRKLKDQNKILTPLYQIIEGNNLITQFDSVLKEMKNEKNRQKGRNYYPRVREDIFPKGVKSKKQLMKERLEGGVV